MAKEIRVGIWIRVSSAQQAKTDSPKHHRLRARAYAESRGWTVVTEYNLEGVKGDQVDSHPEFARMLEDIRSGRINVLVFSRLARLGRSLTTLIELAEEFKKCGAQLVSLGENLDTSTPMGRAFFFLAALFAEMEKENIAERIQDSVEIRGQLGKRLGQAAYGYQWNAARQLELNPEQAPIRLLMYDWLIELKSLHLVAERLNDNGYTNGSEEPWVGHQIRPLIEDTTAMGKRRVLYSKRGKSASGKPCMIIRPESEWKYHPAPVIVPEDKWQLANKILKEITRERNFTQPRQYLFAGQIFCSCGGKLYRERGKKGRLSEIYRCCPFRKVKKSCKASVRLPELEQIFLDEIESFYCTEDSPRSDLVAAEITKKENQLKTLKREANKLERERVKLEAEFLELPPAFFTRKFNKIEARTQQIQVEMPHLQGELDHLRQQAQEVERLASEAREIRLSWGRLPELEKRDLGDLLVDRIDIAPDKIEVRLNALPDLFDRREQGVSA